MLLPYWFGWVLRIHPNWNWTKCFHQRRFSRGTSERIEEPPSQKFITKLTSTSFDEYVYVIIIRTGGQRIAYTSSPLRKVRCNLGIEIETLELFRRTPSFHFQFASNAYVLALDSSEGFKLPCIYTACVYMGFAISINSTRIFVVVYFRFHIRFSFTIWTSWSLPLPFSRG